MALRDHARYPIDPRTSRKIAAELGYAPDPALSALAAHRNNLLCAATFPSLGSSQLEGAGWMDSPEERPGSH